MGHSVSQGIGDLVRLDKLMTHGTTYNLEVNATLPPRGGQRFGTLRFSASTENARSSESNPFPLADVSGGTKLVLPATLAGGRRGFRVQGREAGLAFDAKQRAGV